MQATFHCLIESFVEFLIYMEYEVRAQRIKGIETFKCHIQLMRFQNDLSLVTEGTRVICVRENCKPPRPTLCDKIVVVPHDVQSYAIYTIGLQRFFIPRHILEMNAKKAIFSDLQKSPGVPWLRDFRKFVVKINLHIVRVRSYEQSLDSAAQRGDSIFGSYEELPRVLTPRD